jgi:hypothetical protein
VFIERHQLIATGIFISVALIVLWQHGPGNISVAKIFILFCALLPIWLYRLLAWLASFGFPEYFARDFGSRNQSGPYAFFFWLVFLIISAFIIFDWSLW